MKKDEKPRAMVGKIAVWCAFDELVPVPDLKPHPKNPNQHTEEQIRILAKIIKNSGWRESITVSKLSGYITKGHGRMMAAVEMGAKQVPVQFQNYTDRSAELQDLAVDNIIADMSWIDNNLLDKITSEINQLEINFDIELLGFNVSETDNLITQENESEGKVRNNFEKGKGSDVDFTLGQGERICLGHDKNNMLDHL
jgi:ParB-like chromosome segregation protein Spo0J